jgi:hypothetical protein
MYYLGATERYSLRELQIEEVQVRSESVCLPYQHLYPSRLAKTLCSPTCLQCQNSLLLCQYQEGGKRGLPAAYIAALEMRLAETETALSTSLIALQELDGLQLLGHDLRGRSTSTRQRSKAEKVEEWRQLPLQTSEQLKAWLHAQHHIGGSSSRVISTPDPNRPTLRIERSWTNPPVPSTVERGVHSTPGSAIQQLRFCNPPVTPNVPQEIFGSVRWQDNYF